MTDTSGCDSVKGVRVEWVSVRLRQTCVCVCTCVGVWVM